MEYIKGKKLRSLEECLMWCAENKPIYSSDNSLVLDSGDYCLKYLRTAWDLLDKAIPKPQPIVIEGTVDQLHINHNAICIRVVKGDAPTSIIGKDVSLTIYPEVKE